MKRVACGLIILLLLFTSALAGRRGGYVHGYTKSNGTWVNGYYRGPSSSSTLPKNYGLGSASLPKSSWPAPYVPKETRKIAGTTYMFGETYDRSGLPVVERSVAARDRFLRGLGYDHVPDGYEVDHIIPLWKGGPDQPWNMQLLTKEAHLRKTASELRRIR